MDNGIVILGAGIAGIAASYRLSENGIESVVYEKEDTYGGLCNSFTIDGFTFDTFAHISFDNATTQWLEANTPHLKHTPSALNFDNGLWLKHPVQNNLYSLPVNKRIELIQGFINRDSTINPGTYADWLIKTYGIPFSHNYPYKYTRKYWTVNPDKLEPDWVKGRMYEPSLEEVLYGAMTDETGEVHYSKEARYPQNGGFKSFLSHMADKCNMMYNKCVAAINPISKTVGFNDGSEVQYDNIISTIPLPELCKMIDGVPDNVKKAAEALDYTGGIMVSLGFNKEKVSPSLWFYIYDEDIMPARVYSPDWKSPANVPKGCSAIQAETYFSKYKPLNVTLDELLENCVSQLLRLKLFDREDIIVKDIRMKKYANVMFTPAIYESRKIIHEYLNSINIDYAGRFGEWDYLWVGQSLLSGRKAAERVISAEM